LPDPFIRVVERALDESPAQRFESAGALETALVQVLPARKLDPIDPPAPTLKILLAIFALLVLGLASFTVFRIRGASSAPGEAVAATGTPQVTEATTAPSFPGSPTTEYRIDAAFYRDQIGAIERLTPGTRLSPNEALSLQVELSAPAYVYVVNEDESGASYLLFPLPGLALSNPLQPGQRHRLPGTWNGESISWQVTSAGRKEHFLIVASPERSLPFEEMFATLPRPSFDKPAIKLSPDGVSRLRSVGGLTPSPYRGDRQLRLLPEFSTPLASAEERVTGVWIRHATFENPVKP
jgi:hypothetical protein